MTYESDCALPEEFLEQIAQQGFDPLPDLIQIVTHIALQAATRHGAETLLAQAVKKNAPQATRLTDWIETNIPEGLTVFPFPDPHRRLLRTTNSLERLNREFFVVRVWPLCFPMKLLACAW